MVLYGRCRVRRARGFRSEINHARELFDVRFGTSGRSLSLINNRYSWLDEPIATKTSILRGLKKIGEQMNSDEDVLLLTLSSHGNEDILQLANAPVAMDNLESAWLREALDEAGIRWRLLSYRLAIQALLLTS